MAGNEIVPQGQHRRLGNVTIEDAQLMFRNFAGEEGPYNAAGDRSFSIRLTPEQAEMLLKDGWNVKTRPPREEGDSEMYYIKVAVSFKNRPPTVVIVTQRWNSQTKAFEPARTSLPEDFVDLVDSLDIAKADLVLNPYRWNVRGETGIKAYLKSIYITVQQDDLELKYAQIPEVDQRGNLLEIASAPHEAFDPDEIVIEEEDIIYDEEQN